MSLASAIYDTVHEYGVEEMAAALGRSASTVQHMANPHAATHNFPPLDLVKIQQRSKNYAISHAIAAALGGTFVEPADFRNIADDALLDMFLTMSRRVGDFAADFQKAWADGRLDRGEFEAIKADLYGVKQIADELELRMAPMVEGGPRAES